MKERDNLEQQFQIIYEKYIKLVCYIIIKIVKIKSVSEEIANDAFLILFNHWNSIENKTKIKSYLIKTAKRLAYQYIDKYKLEHEMLDYSIDVYRIEDKNSSSENNFDSLLSIYKNVLNEKELDLLIKNICFGYTVKELAKEYNENIFTTASRIRRAKLKIKKFYKNR